MLTAKLIMIIITLMVVSFYAGWKTCFKVVEHVYRKEIEGMERGMFPRDRKGGLS